MVDPRDELTDVRMPEVGTDGHVALLITEYLAARADDDAVRLPGRASCTRSCAGSRTSTRRTGGGAPAIPGAEIGLVEHALERLVGAAPHPPDR